jgi:hypothetical protein
MSVVPTMPPLKRIAPICKERGEFQMIVIEAVNRE